MVRIPMLTTIADMRCRRTSLLVEGLFIWTAVGCGGPEIVVTRTAELSTETAVNSTIEVFDDLIVEMPTEPLVAACRVEEFGGVTYWKGTHKPFTGRTVKYDGSFDFAAFIDGQEPEFFEMAEDDPMAFFPEEEPYQEAVRHYVRRHGLDHNIYFFFTQHGTVDDLPILLYGLRGMGESKGPSFVCTRGHCVDALRRITGADVGWNYSDWAAWWKARYGEAPSEWKPGQELPTVLER